MSVMSSFEGIFCRSAPWGMVADWVILPLIDDDYDWSGTVLELGGGAGTMADRLLRDHAEIEKLVLVDVDPAMVRSAGARLARHGDRAEVVLTDGAALPVDPGSVDVVCAWLMLHHVIEWKPLLEKAFGALRPGGRLVGYDLSRAVLGDVLHGVTRSEYLLIDPGELREELTRIGFGDVQVHSKALGQLMTFTAVRSA
ncbi:class I SAM-dependent methyltransferase [Gordonia sp. FQ]|uniref:class I SAM-dependent methyltransferase n=1 Tax=Gordonia sp. FQ TaxID=3446634 RepID=UPI003F8318E7